MKREMEKGEMDEVREWREREKMIGRVFRGFGKLPAGELFFFEEE